MKWLISMVLLGALAQQPSQTPVRILPQPLADRTFQFTRLDTTFRGTPFRVAALVPNVIIVIGRQETPELLLQASQLAYMLGQWTQDAGSSLKKIKKNVSLAPVKFDDQLTEEELNSFNLIVLGNKNRFFKKAASKVTGQPSFLLVLNDFPVKDRQTMIVSDHKAARYLANKRLYFKAGAYKSFFAFVKARIFLEQNNLQAALFTLNDPEGVRGCARPVMLAMSKKEQLPASMLQMAQKRNRLVFKDLKQALLGKQAEKAKAIWQQAMETCYACHQGRDGVARFRKFTPNPGEHGYHQTLAAAADLPCQTCHQGKTEIVGY